MIAVLYIAHGRMGIEVTVEVIGADALHESINVAVDRALTGYIRNCIQVQQQPDAVSARQGHVDSQRIWRLPVLKDGKVFLRSEEESNPGFTVDLLLDGSASRLHCQETIAAQGYILARNLAACGIPVRVSSFCSLRGYTVVRILKDFSEKNAARKIFNYFAAGWNRDGLALRMAGKLLDTAPADHHLLLLSSEFCWICPSANQLQPLPSRTDKTF